LLLTHTISKRGPLLKGGKNILLPCRSNRSDMKCILAAVVLILIATGPAFAQTKKPPAQKQPVPPTTKSAAQSGIPTNAEVRKYFNAKNWAKTIEMADLRLKAYPDDQPSLIMKVLSYGMARNKPMALKSVKALYAAPDTAAIFLATLPMHLGQDIMKADYPWYISEAHKLSPKSASIYLMEASYLTDNSLFDKAKQVALAGEALITDKDRPHIESQFASVLLATGSTAKAYEVIHRLQKAYPKDTTVVSQHYSMLLADKKYADALIQLNRLFELKPYDSTSLRKERAFLYSDLGRKDDACADATRLAATDIEYERLLQKLDCPAAYADLSPAHTHTYSYEVARHGAQYQFIVRPAKVNMNEGITFSWSMTLKPDMKGKIQIGKAALDTAHGQINEFTKGDKMLDNLTTVWVSNAVYRDLKTRGTTIMAASSASRKVFNVVKNSGMSDYSEVRLSNGRIKLIKTIHARSADNEEDVYINDDPSNPIITSMSIGWTITLHDID
jgi:tetratricopeptide (TPR) repeat protein